LKLGNITVDVVQKEIKNIHLSVYPPTGGYILHRLEWTLIPSVYLLFSKLNWIKKQQAKLKNQERKPWEF
jgi:hypothetical protein